MHDVRGVPESVAHVYGVDRPRGGLRRQRVEATQPVIGDRSMTGDEPIGVLTRREAIRRVSALLGGVAFVGGTSLLTACERRGEVAATDSVGTFSPDDIAFL